MLLSQRACGAKLVVALTAALALSACAKTTADEAAGDLAGGGYARGRGVASPGSQQDFVVNVGDRIFFETDSTDLTPTAQATLDKQAEWLNRYGRYSFTMEGHADERGTREYNFALGARRAEVAKLGVNGTQRVDAIETWTRGMIGDKHAGAIRGMMVTAGIVEALELLQSKFASQGAASFSQSHRVPPEQQGRVSDEQWGKMSGAERLDYARGFDQSQFAGAR